MTPKKKVTNVTLEQQLQISTTTELLSWVRDANPVDNPTRAYSIVVLNREQVVWQTPIIVWSENGLRRGVRLVQEHFRYRLAEYWTYALTVYSLVRGRRYSSRVVFNPTINGAHLKGEVILTYLLEANSKSTAHSTVSKAVSRSVRKKAKPSPPVRQTAPGNYISPGGKNWDTAMVTQYSVNSSTGHSHTTSVVSTGYQRASGQRTPNYRRVAKLKQLVPLPYSFYKEVYDPQGLAKTYVDTLGNFGNTKTNDYSGLYLTTVRANHITDTNKIISKLSAKISGGNSANIGEDVATAKQTLSLFSGNAERLSNFAKAVATGNITYIAPYLRSGSVSSFVQKRAALIKLGIGGASLLSSLWLEYRYGVLPLLSDCSALMGTLSGLAKNKPLVQRVSATLNNKQTFDGVIKGYIDTNPDKVCGTVSRTITSRTRIVIDYTIANRNTQAAAQLGLTAPIALAYELIPFSFVADWFLPIGQALQGFSAFDGLAFRSGFSTSYTEEEEIHSIGGSDSAPDIPNVALGFTATVTGGGRLKAWRMNRAVLSDFPSPSLPQFKNPISGIHAANAAALVWQLWGPSNQKR